MYDTSNPTKTIGSRAARFVAALAWMAIGMTNSVSAQELHTHQLDNFKLEGGATLPQAQMHYMTYGTLNAARSNAILLPSHYMADGHGYEWLIGKGKALDPDRDFLITTELFGNGRSSSPSNMPEPFHGPRFPVTSIRDNVAAIHDLLVNELGITHLRAVIGFSMGGQQAFQWAVSYPDFADSIVVTAATAKTWPHGIVRLEGQIAAITADPAFNHGDYTEQPIRGLDTFGLVWAGWLFSQQWWREELWRTGAPAGTTLEQAIAGFRHDFIPGADANNLILQMRTWEQHDVGTTPGFEGDVHRALRSIRARVLYMPSATDLYFPVEDATVEAASIPNVVFKPIPSLWGHTAGAASNPQDAEFLNTQISSFLAGGHSSH